MARQVLDVRTTCETNTDFVHTPLQAYTRNWIGHEFFTQGWTLELVLGNTESDWGTSLEDRPPSMSTGTRSDVAGRCVDA